MKHFVLILAAMAVMGSQSATAQNRVKNLSAESATMNVAQAVGADQTVRLSRYLYAGYNTICLPASLTALVFMLTYGALENFTAKFAAEQGLPSGGLFFTIMAVILLLTRLTAGKVTDQKGEGIFAYTCNLAMLAAFLLMGLVPNTFTYLLSAVLAGYGFGGLEPALQSMAVSIAPPERRGSANSTFLCAYDIGIGIGGGIAGSLISSLGYGHMFVIMSVFNLLAILIYVLFGRTHPSSFSYRKKHGFL